MRESRSVYAQIGRRSVSVYVWKTGIFHRPLWKILGEIDPFEGGEGVRAFMR